MSAARPSLILDDDLPVVPIVQVYEDPQPEEGLGEGIIVNEATQSTQFLSQPLGASLDVSQTSLQSEVDQFSDQDEENDPIIHSFGPFGANLLPRMASITTGTASPEQPRRRVDVLRVTSASPQNRSSSESVRATKDATENPVVNHVVNQLAYSRLSSTPLSTIMGNIPSSLTVNSPDSKENKRLTLDMLKRMIDKTQCIGEVAREGKDAAGKQLESEYYYVPDLDLDEKRRDSVVEGLRKPGLRACRKQHKVYLTSSSDMRNSDINTIFKQYYWRKPK